MNNQSNSSNANDGNKRSSLPKKLYGFDSVSNLSPTMLGRYHAFQPRYKSQTLNFLKHQKIRGKQGFEIVSIKSDEVNESVGTQRGYFRSITEGFKVGVEYDASQISSIVCSSRSVNGLERFKGKITPQCITEFQKLFIVEEYRKTDSNGVPIRMYKPVFALLVD
jgi:hypothetical protein